MALRAQGLQVVSGVVISPAFVINLGCLTEAAG